MKTINISKIEYVRTKKDPVEVQLPTEPIFFFEFHYRVFWAVYPIWTTWQMKRKNKEEEVCEYKVILIDQSFNDVKINHFHARISEFENIYNNAKFKPLEHRLVKHLVDGVEDSMVRTEEYFKEKWEHATRTMFELDRETKIKL